MHKPLRVLIEALILSVVGLALALMANALSPRGLSLTRDYFPSAGAAAVTNVPPGIPGGGSAGSVNMASTHARIEGQGLQAIDGPDVALLFSDPGYAQERIVFVDARNDENYTEGHIPAAYPLDHYYPANDLPGVLPACLQAEMVVVYCTGGDCEDSEFAAILLQEAGVLAERLWVYVGGIDDWIRSGRPIETGARGSGNLRGARP